MKFSFTLPFSIFSSLVLVLVACSGQADNITAPEIATNTPQAETSEANQDRSEEDSSTPTAIDSELCSDKNTGTSMSYSEALAIAETSQCAAEGQLLEDHFCNENSGTWWIDLAVDKPGCNPACVVNANTLAAEINWRCTGALPPAGEEQSSNPPAADLRPEAAVFDYSGWGTYYNEIHGYQVKYPPGVTPLWDDETEAVTFEGPLEENEHWPMFFIGHGNTQFYRPDEGVAVREWVENIGGEPANSYVEDAEIAGLAAYHVTHARSPQSYASDMYYFIKDGQMYSINILHTGDRSDWSLYEQFLQSFAFRQQNDQIEDSTILQGLAGTIIANPPGWQSRYTFEGQDGRHWILGTSDEEMWVEIAEAAWNGIEVQLDGIETPLPGLIDVSNITTLGELPFEPRNLAYFARPSASSVLPADRLGTYHEWSAVDGLLESPWCEGADGSGAGEWLQLEFQSPVEVTMIRISNGYDYSEDIFAKNNRVKRATLVFSDGDSIEWTFEDSRGLQAVPLARAPGPNIMTTSVKIILDEVYQGTMYGDTCIAEVEVWGRPQ